MGTHGAAYSKYPTWPGVYVSTFVVLSANCGPRQSQMLHSAAMYFESVRAASGSPLAYEVRSPLMLFVAALPQAARGAALGSHGMGLVIRPWDETAAASEAAASRVLVQRYILKRMERR
jgi:hypothetical protein